MQIFIWAILMKPEEIMQQRPKNDFTQTASITNMGNSHLHRGNTPAALKVFMDAATSATAIN